MKKTFLLALLVLAGCAPTPEVGSACRDFVVVHEMGLSWELLNHRVSNWAVQMPEGECAPSQVDVNFVGGDFSTGESASDTPMLRFGYQRVDSNAGQARAAVVSIDTVVGPDPTVSGTRTFSRKALGLRGFDTVVAVIHGIGFDTSIEQSADYPDNYDPAHGYTMRGFGASAEATVEGSDEIVLDWTLTFHAANSPDRPSLNAAIPHAQIGAELEVLLIGTDAPTMIATHKYAESHPAPEPLEDNPPPHADEATQRLTVAGESGKPSGIYGFGSFNFVLPIDGTCDNCALVDSCGSDGFCVNGGEEPGEYLREISVGIELENYDKSTGEATFLVDGYVSNASAFIANYPLVYEFEANVVWAQVRGAKDAVRLEETFETGEATFDLP